MKRIEYYHDYREYLKEYYDEQKFRSSHFSYRYFCNKAGISSPALFKEVVEGHRNLTERTTEAFIKGLGLTELDANYFRTLVHFNQTENQQEKNLILEQLRGLRRKVKQQVVPKNLHEFYSHWYYPALRELACIVDWHDDAAFLGDLLEPPVSATEAQDALTYLIANGFIKKNYSGRYEQSDPAITTGSEVISDAVRLFNETLARKGADSVQNFPPAERDVRAVVAGISRKSYLLIKEELRDFISRMIRITDDDNEPDRVYSLSVQLFPLSKRPPDGDASL
ncbi:MAG TPA: TIGR02147 family protein [Chitinispirillaceae bacterium]|nr:TIGR02147 family protein [Chitinispirillaceae bacterium]